MHTVSITFEGQGSLKMSNGAEAAQELNSRHIDYRTNSPTTNVLTPRKVAPGVYTLQTPCHLLSDSNMQIQTIVLETPRSLNAL